MRPASLRLLAGLLLILSSVVLNAATVWDPVTAEDLAAKQSPLGEKADMEALTFREDLEDIDRGSRRKVAIRMKIYTDRGVELMRKYAIDLREGENATELRARVVKVDGRIVEVGPESFVHSRTKKMDDRSPGKVTFTLPELVPGDIIDLMMAITNFDASMGYLRVVQATYPIRNYTFNVLVRDEFRMVSWLNHKDAESTRKGHKVTVRMRNLPAYAPEPFAPPESEQLATVVTARIFDEMPAKALWPRYLGFAAIRAKQYSEPDRAIKNEVARLTAGLMTPLEKLRALYRYCQTQITVIDEDGSPAAAAEVQRREQQPGKRYDASEVFKAKMGFSNEVIDLFHAMSRAAGMAPSALLLGRNDRLRSFDADYGWAFAGEKLLHFDLGEQQLLLWPGDASLSFGDVPWYLQGAKAVIAERGDPQFVQVPVNQPDEARRDSQGDFEIDEEGNLTGEIFIRYSGQEAWLLRKQIAMRTSIDDFNIHFLAEWRESAPQLELRDFEWSGERTSEGDLVLKAHVSIPNYAELIGDRRSLVANPFLLGSKKIFTAETRTLPLAFPLTKRETARATLRYPASWTAESISSPPAVGNEKTVIGIAYRVSHDSEKRLVTVESDFVLGRGATKDFPVTAYPIVKKYFELKAKQDEHRLLFKASP